ncbi:MAG: chemotaxis protein CheX [Kofleriaceae bacterium]
MLTHQLHDLLGDAARDMFTSCGETVASSEPHDHSGQQYGGVLGIIGNDLSGSALIVVEASVLVATNPAPDIPVAKWLAELTNQIVGRFKNELLRRGVEVWLAIPTVLRATKLTPLMQNAIEPIHLRVGSGAVTLWLEFEGSPTLAEPVEAEAAREGDALMF